MLAETLSPARKLVVMAGAMLGLLVVSVNQTVVSTALPRIIGELGGLSLLSWVFTAYMLTSTVTVPIAGKLSDLYGRKRFIIAGIILFTLASALAGLSQSMLQLVLFRGLQGIGGGIVFANAFSIVGDIYSPAERGKYQGVTAAVFGLSSVIGPTVGGAITDHLNWRWVFYVNVPLAIIALIVLWLGFPGVRKAAAQHTIDYTGVAALTLFTVPLLLALVWAGDQYPWISPEFFGLLALSAAGLALFLRTETRAEEPVLPLHLFRIRAFAAANLSNFLRGMAMIGTVTFMPMYMQGVLHASATNSGLAVMPMMMGLVVGSTVTGQVLSRTGRYRLPLLAASVLLSAGLFLLAQMDEHTTISIAVRNMIITGLGLGIAMPVLNLALQNSVPYRHLGVASSSSPFFFQIGGTWAVAVFGTMINTNVRDNLRSEIPADVLAATPPNLTATLEDPQTLLSPAALGRLEAGFANLGPDGARLFSDATLAMRAALSDAVVGVFFLCFIIALTTIVAAFFMPERLERAIEIEEGELPAPDRAQRGAPAGQPRPASEPEALGRSVMPLDT